MSQVMIVVGVPESGLETVLSAMADAGAGVVGEYTHCSYTSEGLGRFLPGAAANPAVGQRGKVNQVAEVRVETFCAWEKAKAIVQAIRQAHPYEVPVIYIIPLLDEADL
ncbi:MAG: divalent cation tolerance protein CutA [Anaerolineae bacterium]|nr:divalent cation tolerance protein CutA [Anaerolineae bacterium]